MNTRYFLVTFTSNNMTIDIEIVSKGFFNRKEFNDTMRLKFDLPKEAGIVITNLYEFATKLEFDEYTRK